MYLNDAPYVTLSCFLVRFDVKRSVGLLSKGLKQSCAAGCSAMLLPLLPLPGTSSPPTPRHFLSSNSQARPLFPLRHVPSSHSQARPFLPLQGTSLPPTPSHLPSSHSQSRPLLPLSGTSIPPTPRHFLSSDSQVCHILPLADTSLPLTPRHVPSSHSQERHLSLQSTSLPPTARHFISHSQRRLLPLPCTSNHPAPKLVLSSHTQERSLTPTPKHVRQFSCMTSHSKTCHPSSPTPNKHVSECPIIFPEDLPADASSPFYTRVVPSKILPRLMPI